MTQTQAKISFIKLVGADIQCLNAAGKIIDEIYHDLGSCKTCEYGRDIRDETDFCIKLNIDNLPGYCGLYERREDG